MKIEKFAMRKKTAYNLWKEYKQACKNNPKDAFLQDMKKVYNQLKSGRKVIDIYEVFRRSGFNKKYEPRIAIAQADCSQIRCRMKNNGDFCEVAFMKSFGRYEYTKITDITIASQLEIFTKMPNEFTDKDWRGQFNGSEKDLMAIVPKIPASIRPIGNLNRYYILWEIRKWKPIPPKDPYLLRRITRNMFVIVAGWELTELERAVMKGRVY